MNTYDKSKVALAIMPEEPIEPVDVGEVVAANEILMEAMTNVVCRAIKTSEHGKDWHNNWIVIDNDDEGRPLFKAFEPDNTCIYTGVKIDDACKALNNSTFGE